MAALNEPYTGDIHGVRGADYYCYREARRAGLRGTFRAFLSSRVQNVDSIVRQADRKLPVSNLRGEVLFNSWADMFKGDGAPFPHPPRIYSFSGKNVLTDLSWPHKAAWHGALVNGERALDTSCDAWHSQVITHRKCRKFKRTGVVEMFIGEGEGGFGGFSQGAPFAGANVVFLRQKADSALHRGHQRVVCSTEAQGVGSEQVKKFKFHSYLHLI